MFFAFFFLLFKKIPTDMLSLYMYMNKVHYIWSIDVEHHFQQHFSTVLEQIHWPFASRWWQILSHNVVSNTPHHDDPLYINLFKFRSFTCPPLLVCCNVEDVKKSQYRSHAYDPMSWPCPSNEKEHDGEQKLYIDQTQSWEAHTSIEKLC